MPLWLLGFAGSAVPLLMRPTGGPGCVHLGTAVELSGLVLLSVALVSLRRSFAVVPANRGIRDGGLFRLVRHPVYASELTVLLGIVLTFPSPANIAVWMLAALLQLLRACAEERFLAADPRYLRYRRAVRYRLIPGVI